MRSRFATGLAVTALAVLLTGCSAFTAPPAEVLTMPVEKVELMTADSGLGQVVVDADGMTLYMFDSDTQGSGVSTCEGDCLVNWPPVTTESDAPAVKGVTGEVGTITGTDGSTQVTLNGWPLYYFVGDAAAGDTNGQGLGDVWWVLDSAGVEIRG